MALQVIAADGSPVVKASAPPAPAQALRGRIMLKTNCHQMSPARPLRYPLPAPEPALADKGPKFEPYCSAAALAGTVRLPIAARRFDHKR